MRKQIGIINESKVKPNLIKEGEQWFYDLLAEVTKAHGKFRNRPQLIFRTTHYCDHGCYKYGWYQKARIILTLRSKEQNDSNKYMLLHEIAHYLTHGHGHDKKFYKMCFSLYKQYNIPQNLVEHEFHYKKNSKSVYQKMTGEKVGEEFAWVKLSCPVCGAEKMAKLPKENIGPLTMEHTQIQGHIFIRIANTNIGRTTYDHETKYMKNGVEMVKWDKMLDPREKGENG
jgi:hypothetical protein